MAVESWQDIQLDLEDFLLGSSGMCMLFEEFRLLASSRDRRSEINDMHNQMLRRSEEIKVKQQEILKQLGSVGPEMREAINKIFQTSTG